MRFLCTVIVLVAAVSAVTSDSESSQQGDSLLRINRGLSKNNRLGCALFAAGACVGSLLTGGAMKLTQPEAPQPQIESEESGMIMVPIVYRTSATTTGAGFIATHPIFMKPSGPLPWYCPSGENDFMNDGGNVNFFQGGWDLSGYGRVRGKSSFNLLGGSIQFKMYMDGALPGVNTNFYTVSPRINDPSVFSEYCDIQEGEWESCMELDILENNGNCKTQSTVHTVPLWGNPDCDRGGCYAVGWISPGVHEVESRWAEDGTMTTVIDGKQYLTPQMTWQAKQNLINKMNSDGALIVSSQWTGWVPEANACPGGGDLGASKFKISDVKVQGRLVHGATPTNCN